MNKEKILLEALNTFGNFTTVRQEFNENQLEVIYEAMELVKKCSIPLFSSCYAVFDEEDNIVQLYQTEEKANKGLWKFQNSHPHTEFYVDTMQIN